MHQRTTYCGCGGSAILIFLNVGACSRMAIAESVAAFVRLDISSTAYSGVKHG